MIFRKCVQDTDRFQKCHVRTGSQEAFTQRPYFKYREVTVTFGWICPVVFNIASGGGGNTCYKRREERTSDGNLNGTNFVGDDLVVGREGG
jgi:hypothetical protein